MPFMQGLFVPSPRSGAEGFQCLLQIFLGFLQVLQGVVCECFGVSFQGVVGVWHSCGV